MPMHIRALLVFAIIAFAAFPVTARAEISVGTVDVQKLMSESDAAKNIQKQIEEQRKKFMEDVSKQEQSLRATEQKLAAEHDSLPPEEFNRKKGEFEKQFLETRAQAQKRKKVLDEAVSKAMGKLQAEILKVVQQIASEKGYNLVLSRQQVVVAESSIDISTEALEKLNKAISKIALEIDDK